MTQHTSRSCPLCDSREYVVRISIRRDGRDYPVVDCSRCGFTYVPVLFSATYRSGESAPVSPPRKSRYSQIKKVCDRELRAVRAQRKASVVEIGAGWGGLASVFSRDAGYSYVGFEPSADRAAYSRGFGLNVVEGLFSAATATRNVDAIILDNVVEHVENPRQLVKDAVEILAPGGVLVVIVPNVNDIRQVYPAWRRRHHWQPHCHINYFSSASLKTLFSVNGLQCCYFGFDCLSGTKDVSIVPRVLSDKLGMHLLGLNCYGVKG